MTDYTVLLVFESPCLDRFLLARHRERGWELPGGRVEPGEDVVASARREWDEETGLPLSVVEPLLLHHRPGGDRGHIFLGAVHAAPGLPVVAAERLHDPKEKIEAVRAVSRLDEVDILAFPDDPYPDIAAAAWHRAGRSGWSSRPGEGERSFAARLTVHPGRSGGRHTVVPHPRAPP